MEGFLSKTELRKFFMSSAVSISAELDPVGRSLSVDESAGDTGRGRSLTERENEKLAGW